ncbi:hypothetical protein AVDCRST_MAG84-1883 [uncultured Microcoleus sp.]|uniref:Uncharacterized protein n=1 Tax=uncultured Microcoleus sp. TaxID=259945 RepID=A0A6J4LGG4_9CYAN|nr:hypothetical protein AVDCRST_MAG84-1883 [uncultured Microcoleus sp.]
MSLKVGPYDRTKRLRMFIWCRCKRNYALGHMYWRKCHVRKSVISGGLNLIASSISRTKHFREVTQKLGIAIEQSPDSNPETSRRFSTSRPEAERPILMIRARYVQVRSDLGRASIIFFSSCSLFYVSVDNSSVCSQGFSPH